MKLIIYSINFNIFKTVINRLTTPMLNIADEFCFQFFFSRKNGSFIFSLEMFVFQATCSFSFCPI